MKRFLLNRFTALSFLFSVLFTSSYGQLTIVDTGNCLNHVLHATVTGTLPLGTGITADDAYSGVFPLGFTFNFYGTPNTSCVIGSNGMICFNLTLAGAYCPWPISAALLGNTSALNSVCGPWCDILISAGGSITYSTAGVAPNRKFAVTWCGSRMFSCTTQWTTSQIILYEGTDIVEVHTAHKDICAWNGGRAITGVQNAAGTLATVAPGRDWTPSWSVLGAPEAWRFTPGTPASSGYTVSSIPYAPMPYATSAVYWYDSTTGAYLGSGPFLTVSPTLPTTYMAAAIGCNDTTKAYIHVLPPSVGIGGIPHIDTFDVIHPSECGKCDGKIVLRGVNPHQIDTVFWSFNGVPQPSYVDSAALDSTITLSNLCGGVYDYVYVKVANCPSNQITATLVTPVLAVSNTTWSHPTVCGKYDGWIKLWGLTPMKPVSIGYNKNGVPQTPYVAMVAADSTVVVPNLGAGSYTSIVATVNLCSAPAAPVTLVNPPPYTPTFETSLGLGCKGDTLFTVNTTTPSGYYSYWNWGDGSYPQDSLNQWHVFKTHLNTPKWKGTYTVTLTYNTTPWHDPACAVPTSKVIDIDHSLNAQFNIVTGSTPVPADSICVKTPVKFVNTTTSGAGGSDYTPTYKWWFGNGDYDFNNTFEPEYDKYLFAGNFKAALEATDIIGCTDTDTQKIVVVSLDVRTNVHDTDVCLRTPMPIYSKPTLSSNLVGALNYAWTQTPAGSNLDKYTIQNPMFWGIGNYTLGLTVTTRPFGAMPDGCAATEEVVVRSHPPLILKDVTASGQIIKLGQSIQLNAAGAEFYKWAPENGSLDNPNINNPVATPQDSVTVYEVQGMNVWGCRDTATVTVYTDLDVDQFVPTAFTPNGDGKNDIFRILRLRFQKLVDFRVYNRWGEMMFQSSNPELGWDGTYKGVKQDMGVYMYEVIVALPSGENKSYKGNVMLIR